MSERHYERRRSRRRKPRRRRLGGCVAAFAIAIVAFGLGALYAISGRDHAPVLTGADHDRVAAELASVRRKLEAVRNDARAGRRRGFELVVSDEQLNLLLSEDQDVRERLAARGVEEAWVRIEEGAIVANAIRAMGGMSVQVRATLLPELVGDREVRARIQSLQVGRISAPSSAAQGLADEVGRLISRQITDTRARLTGLKVVGNRIELSGSTR